MPPRAGSFQRMQVVLKCQARTTTPARSTPIPVHHVLIVWGEQPVVDSYSSRRP